MTFPAFNMTTLEKDRKKIANSQSRVDGTLIGFRFARFQDDAFASLIGWHIAPGAITLPVLTRREERIDSFTGRWRELLEPTTIPLNPPLAQ
jgi:hypothetical protein